MLRSRSRRPQTSRKRAASTSSPPAPLPPAFLAWITSPPPLAPAGNSSTPSAMIGAARRSANVAPGVLVLLPSGSSSSTVTGVNAGMTSDGTQGCGACATPARCGADAAASCARAQPGKKPHTSAALAKTLPMRGNAPDIPRGQGCGERHPLASGTNAPEWRKAKGPPLTGRPFRCSLRIWAQPMISCSSFLAISSMFSGGQPGISMPRRRPIDDRTSLISLSDLRPKFGVRSISASVFWTRSPI